MMTERLFQRLRLHHVGVNLASMRDWIDSSAQSFGIGIDDEIEPELFAHVPVAICVHVAKFPGRIDVEQWEGEFARVKRLAREMEQNGAVFADRVKHHRPLETRDDFSNDVNALGLERLEMRELSMGHEGPARARAMSQRKAEDCATRQVRQVRRVGVAFVMRRSRTGDHVAGDTSVREARSQAALRPRKAARRHAEG